MPAISCSSGSSRSALSPELSMKRPWNSESGPLDFFRPRNAYPTLSTSSRNLWIALWLSAVTPTRWPCFISSTARRAPVYVFPEPGGPWTKT